MSNFNGYGNCSSDLQGSGVSSCSITTFGDITGFLLSTGNEVITASMSKTAYVNKIKRFSVIPYNGIYDFEQNTPDNDINTSSTSVMTQIRAGKPQFSFSFTKGSCLHKSLYQKTSNGDFNLSLLFNSGILLAKVSENVYNGFKMGMFDVETFKLLQGTDPQKSTVKVQLLDAVQFNLNNQFITWEALGFNLNDINGVVDTNIIATVDPDLPRKIDAVVKSSCNSDYLITSLREKTNWSAINELTKEKLDITEVSFNEGSQSYSITLAVDIPPQGAIIRLATVGTGGIIESLVAEDILGNLYKGKSNLAIAP